MPKKGQKLSEEQKAKMAAGRAKAKAAKEAKEEPEFEPTEVKEKKAAEQAAGEAKTVEFAEPPVKDEVEDVVVPEQTSQPLTPPADMDANQLMQMMAQTQQMIAQTLAQNPQVAQATPEQKVEEVARLTGNEARVGAKGVQGIVFRYPVERDWYPDPTDRLLDEPQLRRFAMRENYIFRWAVDGETYEKNGVTFSEPRFTVELFRRLYDDEGQETGKMALVARHMQMEDEMTTRKVAQELQILDKFPEGEEGFRQLMSEVRYHRIQQWLLDIFRPAKIKTFRKRPTQQVIDGKVVEVYDTEELTDKDTAASQASTLKSEAGVGGVAVPGAE